MLSSAAMEAGDLAGTWEAALDFAGISPGPDLGPLRLKVRQEPGSDRWIGIVGIACTPERCAAKDVLARSSLDAVSREDADQTRHNLIEGLNYRVFDGTISERAFSFWISNNELWDDWCAAQSPKQINVDGNTGYACGESGVPYFVLSRTTMFPMRSGRDELCTVDSGACTCSETSCRLNPYTMTTSFDVTLTNHGVLQGTAKFLFSPRVSITFTRTQGAQR